jgi:hypothetical protein
MKPVKKYLLFTFIALVTIAAVYAYREYNRKATDLFTAAPQEIVNATDMTTAFANDETIATKKFAGKTVLVTGFVTEIINQKDTLLNIFLGNDTDINKISCLMDMRRKETFKNIVVGKQISIKGMCTGFLADVEMNRCVIVNQK